MVCYCRPSAKGSVIGKPCASMNIRIFGDTPVRNVKQPRSKSVVDEVLS
jgi:hypothetical protein